MRSVVAMGAFVIGWGCFHVIDQFVFHLALRAHHIREGMENPEVYDWTFFSIGLVLIAIGTLVLRSADVKSAMRGGSLSRT